MSDKKTQANYWNDLLETCSKCNKEFSIDEVTIYKKLPYCAECLKAVKEENKKSKKKTSKKEFADDSTDKLDIKIENYTPIAIIEELTKKMETMQKDQDFLKDLVLKSIGSTPESQKMSNKYRTLLRKALMGMLNDITNYTFDDVIDAVVKKFGFHALFNKIIEYREVDKGGNETIRKSNFFFTRCWSNRFDQNMIISDDDQKIVFDLMNSPSKIEAAEFINRIKRGERKQLDYAFNEIMEKMRSFTNVYLDLLDKLEEEEIS